jgi:RNA polymerase sigma-70 factor (ECF subfamily)
MSGPEELALAFQTHLAVPSLPVPEVGDILAKALEAGRLKWPGIDVAPETYAGFVAARVEDAAELAALELADLFLTCACQRKAPAAMERFESVVMSKVPSYVARIDPAGDFADEVKQQLRVKLFLEKPARIGQYAGRGSLEGWVCAAAVRTALTLVRARNARPTPASDDLGEDLPGGPADPELALLREHHREEFERCTREAIASLTAQQRNLLRFYYVERLTLEKLGALHQAHPTTVMRWLAGIRTAIFEGVRERLHERLKLSPSEFHELAAAVQSRLNLSISKTLIAA